MGKIIKATPLPKKLRLKIDWPAPGANEKISKIKIHDKTYALMTYVLEKNNLKQPILIKVAYNISHDENTLADFSASLWIINAIGLFFALIISAILMRISLNPLSSFVDKISQMDTNNLHELNVQNVSAELGPLLQAFNELIIRIKAGYTRLSEFSSNIAHELRTPINNLMIESEVILSQSVKTHLSDEIKEHINSSLEEYQRLSRIIDRLLFLARAEAKAIMIDKIQINLADEVKAVLAFYQAMADEKKITFALNGNGEITADQILFRNAFSNLLANAINYNLESTVIHIEIENSQDRVKISVIDNGIGIAEQHLHRLSERFYRVDDHRSSSLGGSGLGLSIVDTIMRAHNGELVITSNVPRGTTASLIFFKAA